jgi:hypothetical protein
MHIDIGGSVFISQLSAATAGIFSDFKDPIALAIAIPLVFYIIIMIIDTLNITGRFQYATDDGSEDFGDDIPHFTDYARSGVDFEHRENRGIRSNAAGGFTID